MKERINKFKNLSLEKQKEIIIIILEKSIDKSEGLKKLYNLVKFAKTDISSNIIKEEFLKIYIFLLEAVDYIKSKDLEESISKLNKINKSLDKIRKQEKLEKEKIDLDSILELELNNL